MEKTEQVEDFMKACGREDYLKIKSEAKTDNRLYVRISSEDNFELVVQELIEDDKKVGICCNTKKEAEARTRRLCQTR